LCSILKWFGLFRAGVGGIDFFTIGTPSGFGGSSGVCNFGGKALLSLLNKFNLTIIWIDEQSGPRNKGMPSISFIAVVSVLTPRLSDAGLPRWSQTSLALHRRGGSSNTDQPSLNCTYSTCSVQGERPYMEDEYFVSSEGTFAAVFDGHGGRAISRYAHMLMPLTYYCVALNQLMLWKIFETKSLR
jgi:hypothetical protein